MQQLPIYNRKPFLSFLKLIKYIVHHHNHWHLPKSTLYLARGAPPKKAQLKHRLLLTLNIQLAEIHCTMMLTNTYNSRERESKGVDMRERGRDS